MVTTAAKASGSATIQRYLKVPRLATMARTTDRAMVRAAGFARTGNSVLMPPSGSVTPISNARLAATITAVAAGPRPPGVVLELRDEVADRVLRIKRATRVPASDRRQDEERLEHDGEVVPERHHGGAADKLLHDVGQADGEGGGAAGAEMMLYWPEHPRPWARTSGVMLTPARPRLKPSTVPPVRARRVHGEVDAAVDRDRCDKRHDGDEGFHQQHAAVTDEAGLAFLLDKFSMCGGDQGVEAGECAAGDGHEEEREDGSGEDRLPVVAGGEFAECGHVDLGPSPR